MNIENLYRATVISNNSQTGPTGRKNGSVKIQINSLHSEVPPSDLPWARPFILGGGGILSGISDVPEMNDKIWVFPEKPELYDNWMYIAHLSLENIMTFLESAENFFSSMGLTSIYPDIKFRMLPNNIILGASASKSTPEVFVYHPSNKWFVMDSLKSQYMNLSKTISIEENGVELKLQNGTSIVSMTSSDIKAYNSSGQVVLGNAVPGSQVTTVNAHAGVIDTITGAPIVASICNVFSLP